MGEITKAQVIKWIAEAEDEFAVEQFRKWHNIAPESNLYKIFSELRAKGILKSQGYGRYRKVKEIDAIKWWNGELAVRIPLLWPEGDDGSTFGFEDTVEIFSGDTILLAGESNTCKTAFALNILKDNAKLFGGCRLMVNEYKPQRFRRSIEQFPKEKIWDGDKPIFELLPIIKNHEDYILPNQLNIIDWLLIKGNFWEIAEINERIQMNLRNGIAVINIQKTGGKDYGTGGDWGKFLPAFYATAQFPSIKKEGTSEVRLVVHKVKSAPLGKMKPDGKSFAFDIIHSGTTFSNIREVRNCPKCKTRGYYYDKECDVCYGKGFVDK